MTEDGVKKVQRLFGYDHDAKPEPVASPVVSPPFTEDEWDEFVKGMGGPWYFP